MAKTCKVEFRPDGVSAQVPQGATILSAAVKAGVLIDSLCGGEGVCGRCRVIVRQGTAAGGSNEFFTPQEAEQGYVLACQGRVESDLAVEVPPSSRLGGATQHVPAEPPLPVELGKQIGRLAPLVRKIYLELAPPDLGDNSPDLQRLEEAIRNTFDCKELRSDIEVIRRLP